MAISLLVGSHDDTRIVVGYLRRRLDIPLVVWEHPPKAVRRRMMWRRLRKLGFWENANAALFKLYYGSFLMASDQQRRTEILREGLGDLDELAAISRRPGDIDTPSVSHPSVAEALKAASPAAIGVSGTTLIKPPVLGCLGVPMINIHAGWTPHYRGSHGAYWAVVARDWEHCGVTVHLVDAGVDTGGILCRVLIKPDERDSVYSLAAKQTVAGLSAMARCLDLAQRGQFPPSIRAETKGKVFYTPTLTSYGRLRQNIRNSGR